MGRRKNKEKKESEPDFDWPFEISIKLNRNRDPIAFMSGVERDYYPEDPGHSKFGLTFCLPISDDTAKPNYMPSEDHLDKPISLLGYGIGGLLGPRFAPLPNEDNPPPNVYQSELVPPPTQRLEKAKRKKWKDFVREYEDIVAKQYAKFQVEENGEGLMGKGRWQTVRKSIDMRPVQPPKQDAAPQHIPHHHSSKLQLNKRQEMIKQCAKRHSAFGMGLENPRFPHSKADDKVGVGTYDTTTSTRKGSFQITTQGGHLVPRVRVVCHPQGYDTCMVCARELFESDYYQTINKFRILNKTNPEVEGPYKLRHLSMCRSCYCEALHHGCPPWNKDKIPKLFLKARHCYAVHDHKEGHPEFLMKTTCKKMIDLARREQIYSRYFKDNPCEHEKSRG